MQKVATFIFRGSSTWTVLTPGTNGQFLQTQGASANVQWATVSGSGTISDITSTGSTITVTVVTDGFAWSEQTTNFNAAVENGYYCNNGLTVTLPATAGLLVGNTVIIYEDTTSTVTIQANTGQSIQVSNSISSSGGTAVSNTQGSLLELNFKPSDTTWHTVSSMGTWETT